MAKDFNTGLKKGLETDQIKLNRRRRYLLREMGLSEDLSSTELAEKLYAQNKVVDCLNRSLAAKDKEIDLLRARIAALEGGSPFKQESIVKTCLNSSIPPSKNPIGIPHTKSQRVKSDKKSGGQVGHQGSTRMQSEDVNKTERWYPSAICPKCGKPLDMETATECSKRQVIDIPISIMAEIIDHLQMQVKCTCGHCSKGQYPENVKSPLSYGPNIMALTSYLSTYQNVPFKKLTHIFKTMFGLHMSEGTISNMLNTMRKLSEKPYEMIRQRIAKSNVAGADETGINVSGKNNWLWAFQNDAAVYLAFDKSRSHQVINDNFSSKEQKDKVWISDRWGVYFMDSLSIEDHQICLAHLIRNLTYTMEAFKEDPWSLDMLDLLKESIHLKNKGEIGPEVKATMQARLDELLQRPPIYTRPDKKPTELDVLKTGIAKHKDFIFTFLVNPKVSPTNNDSEKALRPAKTKLKVSGCFRSEDGAKNYATVGSVIQTAIKNGQNPFEVLRVIASVAAEL